jgi:hypothetical protein
MDKKNGKLIVIPLLFFILYLVVIYRYHYHNNIMDKLVYICLIVYYSILDIRYGLVACFFLIIYLNMVPAPVQTGKLMENFDINNILKSSSSSIDSDDDDDVDQDRKNTGGLNIIKSEPHEIELVVARYNENLNWLNRDPFDKYPVYIYNKGSNDNYTVNNKNVRIKKLNNVGKCDHTYLYHIIENYDNLADVTVFLPGSTSMKYKIGKAKKIMAELKKKIGSVFIGNFMTDVKQSLYKFSIDTHKTANKDNFTENPDIYVEKSKIRPFGKWFENKFGDITITHLSYLGIMAISKEHILQHSKLYYQNLIKELENSSSPEVGHYLERAWEAVFYPMTGATFIRGT